MDNATGAAGRRQAHRGVPVLFRRHVREATGELRELKMEALQSLLQRVMVAGNETTTSAITGGMVTLIQNPQQMRALAEHPERIPNAVEEILRMQSPSAGLWRAIKKTPKSAA